MLLTIYDIETNGFMFKGYIPDVYQLGYIRVDTNYNIHGAGSLYFWDSATYGQFREDAAEVHGITKDFLLTQEVDFEKNLATAYALLHNSLVVGKNNIRFDNVVIQHFLNKYKPKGVPTFALGKSIDVQSYMGVFYRKWCEANGIDASSRKRGALGEYMDVMDINEDVVKYFAEQNGIKLSETKLHDALYDTLVTYMSFVWLMRTKNVMVQPV